MIRRDDLLQAIAECQGERDPNANTCIKLAAYYTILNNMEPEPERFSESYSYDSPGIDQVYSSASEFGQVVGTLDQMDVMRVMDELMETLRVMHPRLYKAVMEKLTTLE